MKKLYILLLLLLALVIDNQAQIPYSFGFSKKNIRYIKVKDNIKLKNDVLENSDKSRAFCFGYTLDINKSFLSNAKSTSNNDSISFILSFTCPKAKSLGVSFSNFQLAENQNLFVYNSNYQNVIKISSKDNNELKKYNSAQVLGDTIFIEISVKKGERINDFTIDYLSYDLKNIYGSLSKMETGVCLDQVPINSDLASDYQVIKHSVVRYTYVDNKRLYYCTGSLINNSKYDQTPYILTAAHCVCNQDQASNLIAYFNYEYLDARETKESSYQTISTATLIATSPTNVYRSVEYPKADFSLLKLSKIPDRTVKPYYAGWSLDTLNNIDNVFSIHHPQGKHKKISISQMKPYIKDYPSDDPSCKYDKLNHWYIDTWNYGLTEVGSSGAPLFNQNNQVIGILSGGYSDCGSPYGDYFQSIAVAWNKYNNQSYNMLQPWLSPNCDAFSVEGYDPFQIFSSGQIAKLDLEQSTDKKDLFLSWNLDIKKVVDINFEDEELEGKDVNKYYSLASNSFILSKDDDNSYLTSNYRTVTFSIPETYIVSGDYLYFKAKGLNSSKISIARPLYSGRVLSDVLSTIVFDENTSEWQTFQLDLSEFDSQEISLNLNITGTVSIDDIEICHYKSDLLEKKIVGYQVYCNNELVSQIDDIEQNTYSCSLLEYGNYEYVVYLLFDDGSKSAASNSQVVSFFDNQTKINNLIDDKKYKLFPIPCQNQINFVSLVSFLDANVRIFDLAGRVVYQKNNIDLSIGQTLTCLTANLKNGIYIFEISDSLNNFSQKFSVTK